MPTFLFIDNFMRKANKAQIMHSIQGKDFQRLDNDKIQQTDMCVIDGESLLRQLTWNIGITFGEIVESYLKFVNPKYGRSTVVFDGYDGGPSEKDHEHERRGSLESCEFKVCEESKLMISQKAFLPK